jgi:hypothetical protein
MTLMGWRQLKSPANMIKTILSFLLASNMAVHAGVVASDSFVGTKGHDLEGAKPQTAAGVLEGTPWSGAAGHFHYQEGGGVFFAWKGNFRGLYLDISPAVSAKSSIKVSVDVLVPSGDPAGKGWFAIGFSANNKFDSFAEARPWATVRPDDAQEPGGGKLLAGPGPIGGVDHSVGLWKPGETNELVLEYVPQGGGSAKAVFSINGKIASETFLDDSHASPPMFVMLGGHRLTGDSVVKRFSVEVGE